MGQRGLVGETGPNGGQVSTKTSHHHTNILSLLYHHYYYYCYIITAEQQNTWSFTFKSKNLPPIHTGAFYSLCVVLQGARGPQGIRGLPGGKGEPVSIVHTTALPNQIYYRLTSHL